MVVVVSFLVLFCFMIMLVRWMPCKVVFGSIWVIYLCRALGVLPAYIWINLPNHWKIAKFLQPWLWLFSFFALDEWLEALRNSYSVEKKLLETQDHQTAADIIVSIQFEVGDFWHICFSKFLSSKGHLGLQRLEHAFWPAMLSLSNGGTIV